LGQPALTDWQSWSVVHVKPTAMQMPSEPQPSLHAQSAGEEQW
jgi:hypothetical protein